MLRPLPRTRRIPGEPPRCWYFSERLDLVVWFDDDQRPVGFELAYDRDADERSIAWHRQRGWRHCRVDDGRVGLRPATPLLRPDGPFDRDAVLAQFLEAAGAMPPELVEFVAAGLRACGPPAGPGAG